jgi:iron complex transport system permease protein
MGSGDRRGGGERPGRAGSRKNLPGGRSHHSVVALSSLAGGLLCLAALSLFLGRYPRPGLSSPWSDPLARMLLMQVRLPRLVTGLLLGMALGGAGQVFQMVLANPLVEPGFLGVSQGAAFGAAIAVVFLGNAAWAVQAASALFGFLGLFLSYVLAHRIRFGGWILRLILAGIAVSALFTAGIGFLKYIADPLEELPEITFWLLGGLWNSSWSTVLSILPLAGAGLLTLWSLRWRLNLLSMSDEVVFSLGTAPLREKTLVLGAAVAATTAVVSVSGIVGWVGLIVPHIARRLFGVDTRFSLPGAMIVGALLTVLCDDAARVMLAGEIPLGILTSLLGAGGFLYLMIFTGRDP